MFDLGSMAEQNGVFLFCLILTFAVIYIDAVDAERYLTARIFQMYFQNAVSMMAPILMTQILIFIMTKKVFVLII